MIHLALSIAAFLFLAWVALIGFGLVLAVFGKSKPKEAAVVQRCPQPCLKHSSCLPEKAML